jgi:Arc/MetJ-type ribon-helix-helix transcriptional regulator
VSAKIAQELHEQLLEKAAQENKSVSEAVREAVNAWVEDKPKADGQMFTELQNLMAELRKDVLAVPEKTKAKLEEQVTVVAEQPEAPCIQQAEKGKVLRPFFGKLNQMFGLSL